MTTLTGPGREVLDMSFFQDPYAVYDRLRVEGPVHAMRTPDGIDVWVITRYEEAKEALSDARFTKDFSGVPDIFAQQSTGVSAHEGYTDILTKHMLFADPPDHTRLRELAAKAFTRRRVEALRPEIQQIVDGLLDTISAAGEVDLLRSLSFPMSMAVTCRLLGIPPADEDAFRTWTETIFTTNDPARMNEAVRGVDQYLVDVIEAKRADPADDLITALINAREDGDRLSDRELVSTCALMFVAGYETTASMVGNAVLALLKNPDKLAELKADPSLMPNAVDELLRFDGPVNVATLRSTATDVTVAGTTIPKGQFVLVSLIAANRDGEKFPEPARLDFTRPLGGSLAFGHGIHYCLGAPLSRVEIEVALSRLLARFPDLSLAREPETLQWRNSLLVRGLSTLPIRLH
ncbi:MULTISPECIES: cytochrome P450 family protein [Streptomyces]|uniref:Cytochrome n=1 Tax=Streptomyces qinglanensis TaxID=943816 RepID=A0A1E7K8J5_9ACTN|nr:MULTISPECIES: cytochrome P450 [Streptomyces]MBE9500656.1 cytochrome P450 [Streptomyces sp. GKU 257-1]OEV00249.1 cytochrome [Streptomyces qinglanensis]OEV07904.1 cytochrome [Streptomyces nanshensis]